MKNLIIVGASAFAEVAFEYFSKDTDYEPVCFSVERNYISENSKLGLPVIAVEDLTEKFDIKNTHFFVAIPYPELNRLRERLYLNLKSIGFKPASYISSKANVWDNVKIGDHCFIFEGNNIQPFVTIGCNVILWSGNHIGHHSNIENNVFISSHVVVSGFCSIGANSFIGVNATIADRVKIGRDNFIGSAANILKDTQENSVFQTSMTEVHRISAKRLFKVKDV